MNPITLAGVGQVTLEELEARFSAWINAGAPKPILEGPREDRLAVLRRVAERGDSQIRAVVESYMADL